jgi:NAD(P)-dependent dehydrogenase (short-subunit alcohol dehydrogenase family)
MIFGVAERERQPPVLKAFGRDLSVAVIGASGGIGHAFVDALSGLEEVARVYSLSRHKEDIRNGKEQRLTFDLIQEDTIAAAASAIASAGGSLNLVVVATGMLHQRQNLKPEKAWRDIDPESMSEVFKVNTIGPALIAKHFLPLLVTGRKSVFAALSARVGSISDNRLGGWHAYRASKTALNMLIKTLSIELSRRNPQAICVGLHPGTVDTVLSAPFQRGVPPEHLVQPVLAVRNMISVIDQLTITDTGRVIAWDGQQIPP